MAKGKKKQGRGRLSSLELLPDVCSPVVAWAAKELSGDDRTAQDIYEEFYTKLGNIAADSHGELEFKIPSRSSFNRYSMRQATLRRRLDDTRRITNAMAESFTAEDSDELALIAGQAINTLIFELITNAGEAGIDPKGAMNLASALKNSLQAQNISTSRRQTIQKEFAGQAKDAIEKVGKAKGLSPELLDDILHEFLGVEK